MWLSKDSRAMKVRQGRRKLGYTWCLRMSQQLVFNELMPPQLEVMTLSALGVLSATSPGFIGHGSDL